MSAEQIDASMSIFQRSGHMSSPTVLFILDELRSRNAGLPCVMLGFGPGLDVEIAFLKSMAQQLNISPSARLVQ